MRYIVNFTIDIIFKKYRKCNEIPRYQTLDKCRKPNINIFNEIYRKLYDRYHKVLEKYSKRNEIPSY